MGDTENAVGGANYRRSSRSSTAGRAERSTVASHNTNYDEQSKHEPPMSEMSEQLYSNKESHYQIGDVGMVPREGQHIPTFLKRSRAKLGGPGSAKSVNSRLNKRQSAWMNSKASRPITEKNF